jgi:hypothetical protein
MNVRWGFLAVAGLAIAGFSACGGGSTTTTPPPNTTPPFQTSFTDSSGTVDTVSQPAIKTTNPFFAVLGTNTRTCASCHDVADGWSVTPTHLQQKFQSTQGTDPIFLPVDGANCPSADVSTLAAKTSAYSLLLNSGLIRMTLPVPAGAEFSITAISDPYQCPETTATQPALYRRPLPATNLKFLNGIMWDGREPDLATQAKDAAAVHMLPSTPPTDAQIQQILSLETALFTAQTDDSLAGDLTAQGATGGPDFLATLPFTVHQLGQRHRNEWTGTAVSGTRRSFVQYFSHQNYRRRRVQRRPGTDSDFRYLFDLPQHAQCRQRFGLRNHEHWDRFSAGGPSLVHHSVQ